MKTHKHILFIITLTAIVLTLSCASTKRNNHRIINDEPQNKIDIKLVDENISPSVEGNQNVGIAISAEEAEKLSEELEEIANNREEKETKPITETVFKKQVIEPKTLQNFNNSIVKYKYEDGKLYTLLLSQNMILDLRLEPNEIPTGDVVLSDIDNYQIESGISYTADMEVHHLFIRCIELNPSSMMILNTNKRTYYFKLIPTENISMVGVMFEYAGQNTKPYSKIQFISKIDDLNFNYNSKGNDKIKPVAVFNDKKTTYIQFSASFLTSGYSPALYVKNSSGLSILNYSVKGNMYITDYILENDEKFVLLQDNLKCEIKRS